MENTQNYALGWLRDLPSFKDYTPDTKEVSNSLKVLGEADSIKNMLKSAGVTASKPALPASKDLRKWCSPIEDQQSIGSCTAHAGVGMIEYYEKRAFGKHIDASRLFLYKVTRNLLKWTGDTGAYLRSTIGAMTLFGVPPEDYWPYLITNYDIEPTAFCYAFGQNYKSITYYRLDPVGTKTTDLLTSIKTHLNSGIPSMFGFSVYNSIYSAVDGRIPYPSASDPMVGGHAIFTVGYDDKMDIPTADGAKKTKGALLIRNSWGKSWGENGYGWLPYDYVLNGIAVDWWVILKNDWINTGNFKA
ncbi:cysteine protease [Solitalea sp. MAHUQ-68]|uniref:Cysteine protease n=1 Tax=Solitalea agri TaxID=2953739 RepID=A0A9X2EYQ2_9SPHI|nr:C1 family peptidase [Solitalea agri]MCO4291437.1 cysteine protease [Solitalea agri]